MRFPLAERASGPVAGLTHLCARAGPGFVLGQTVGNLEPRRFGANKKMTLDAIDRRLIQPAERQAHSFRVIVIGADEARPTDGTEMLCRELRGMKCLDELLALYPGELGGLDGRPGAKGGSVPTPAAGTVAIQDRTELTFDPVLDPFAEAPTCENLG